MSDLQPRKRKDKKRKRDSLDRRSEGELLFLRKQSLSEDEDIKDHHGVHATKMGPEDVHLHVQSDHGTGGHWCAKVLFFSLLVVLLGLVGLIILENRGLSDLDTPLSESRFSEYFDGWVDEHRDSHDDHGVDKVMAELEDHDHDNEPFEEEDTGGDEEGDEEHDAEEADEEHEEVEEQPSEEEDQDEEAEDDQEEPEEEEEDDEEIENNTQEEEPDDDDENDATNEADEDQDEEPVQSYRSKRSISEENVDSKDEDDNDEETDEGFGDADDSNDAENDDNYENNNNDEDNNDEDNDEDDDSPEITTRSSHQQHSTPPPTKSQEKRRGDIDPFDEEDDDDIESLEEVFENDAGELLHLQQRAKEQNAASEQPHEEETESSSLAVKVVVGLALAFVARLVLVKKNLADKTTSGSGDESAADGEPASMRRRFTMIAADDTLPVDGEELLDEDLEEEYLDEEDEELDISEDEQNDGGEKMENEKFEPETFEQLNAMYRPKGFENLSEESFKEEKPSTKEIIVPQKEIKPIKAQPSRSVEVKRDIAIPAREPPKFSAPPPPPIKSEPLPLHSPQPIVFPPIPPAPAPSPVPPAPPASAEPKKWAGLLPAPREWRQPDDEEYDDDLDNPVDEEIDDDYDEEEEIEEEEGEDAGDDDSDVDDADLLQRLEQKYGKLPEKTYDSEDEDVDNSTWTTIKPSKGGAQSFSEDAQIEEDLKRANDEMLQNQFDFL